MLRSLFHRIGSGIRRHKWLTASLVTMLVLAIGGGAVVVSMEDRDYGGTTAPGSHNWWDTNLNNAGIEAAFCNNCHSAIAAELVAGPHLNFGCTTCHAATTDGHVAAPAKCAQCHSRRVTELSNDAHAGIMTDLGETDPAKVSWTCKSCHTHVKITLTATEMAPLPLQMEPYVVPAP